MNHVTVNTAALERAKEYNKKHKRELCPISNTIKNEDSNKPKEKEKEKKITAKYNPKKKIHTSQNTRILKNSMQAAWSF